ncbi:hypothetical protein HMN09_01017500 [Mycena chlorophos]|uniref:Uncharacterized protein n=1 Tax=Mycena chlorophos TaxID=658473 RepID=A0A8H6SEC4_MYCCL|nr:hypothetical protein HMN09_01017500 [Mycena chlorophos]
MLLVVLAAESVDLKDVVSVVGPATVYQTQGTTAIFAVLEASSLETLTKDLGMEGLDIRLYEPLDPDQKFAIPSSKGKHFLVFNGMTPDAGTEDEFNAWYAEEHIPMLRRVPGWRSSVRFKLVDASVGVESVTQYLALHEWERMDAFQTDGFKQATSTAWRRRVVEEGVHKKERLVLEFMEN